jgi:hypothetical protein
MKRDTSHTIWRTVVFAGAMLGAPACQKAKPAPTTPPANTQKPEPVAKPDTAPTPPTQAADPCAGQETQQAQRPRGTPVEDDRPIGRGFVLS